MAEEPVGRIQLEDECLVEPLVPIAQTAQVLIAEEPRATKVIRAFGYPKPS